MSRLWAELEQADSRLCRVTKELYERTIDFGGHPNAHGMGIGLSAKKLTDRTIVSCDYLTNKELPLRFGMNSVINVGLCSLSIFRRVFRERFDLLGITQELEIAKMNL